MASHMDVSGEIKHCDIAFDSFNIRVPLCMAIIDDIHMTSDVRIKNGVSINDLIHCRSCNVLLLQSPNGTISTKIGSMGLLNATLANAILTKCGSVAEIYSAPEVLTSGRASMQGDSFSFGILMIEAIRCAYLGGMLAML